MLHRRWNSAQANTIEKLRNDRNELGSLLIGNEIYIHMYKGLTATIKG